MIRGTCAQSSTFALLMSRTTTEEVFAKIAIRTKICCTTYKKICICEKKAVPLQRENKRICKYYTNRNFNTTY